MTGVSHAFFDKKGVAQGTPELRPPAQHPPQDPGARRDLPWLMLEALHRHSK